MPAKCQRCGGRCRVESSHRAADTQIQYVACTACRAKAKTVVPADQIWRRKR